MQYESIGFLEKNRDTVSKELVNVLRDSGLGLCHKLMELEDSEMARESKSNTSLGGRVVVSASKTLVGLSSFDVGRINGQPIFVQKFFFIMFVQDIYV